MDTISRNNHYVPQLYLRNWSDTPGKVWRYRLLVSHDSVPLWDHPPISYTGSQNDLYTYNDGESESDEFEKWFNKEVEIPASKAIAKAINNNPLSKNDFIVLSKFVAAQYVRTPARLHKQLVFYKDRLASSVERALNRTIKDLEESISNGRPFIRNVPSNDTRFIPAKVSIKKNLDTGDGQLKYETILGRGVWLFEIKHVIQNTSKVLTNHKWQIIKAAPGANWCTSDNPVMCLDYFANNNYSFGGGWGKPGTEILLPLSPKHLLYTQVGSSQIRDDLQMNPSFTFLVQKFIFEHAYRNIYSIKPFESIASCKTRTVNNEIFTQEKDQWAKWYAEQTKAEYALKTKLD